MNRVCFVFLSAILAASVILSSAQPQPNNKIRQFQYTLGYKNEGEEILDAKSANIKREYPENFNIKLSYGPGLLLIYVEIFVEQDSPLSRIHVIDGGLHKEFITIELQGNHTTFLNYRVVYYGHCAQNCK